MSKHNQKQYQDISRETDPNKPSGLHPSDPEEDTRQESSENPDRIEHTPASPSEEGLQLNWWQSMLYKIGGFRKIALQEQEKRAEKESQISILEHRFDEIRREMKSALTELDSDLASTISDSASFEEINRSLVMAIRSSREKLGDINRRHESAETRIARLHEDLQNREKEISSLKDKANDVEQKLNNRDEELNQQREKTSSLENEKTQLAEKAAKNSESLRKTELMLNDKIDKLKTKEEELNNKIIAWNEEREEKEKKIDSLVNDLQTKAADLQKKEEEISSLNTSIASLEEKLKLLNPSQSGILLRRLEETSKSHDTLLTEKEHLEKSHSLKLEELRRENEDRLMNLEKEHKDKMESLQSVHREKVDKLEKDNAEKLERVKDENEKMLKEKDLLISEKEGEINDHKKTIEDKIIKISRLNTRHEEDKKHLDEARKKVDAHKQTIKDKDSEIERLHEDIRNREEEIASQKATIEERDLYIENLNQEVADEKNISGQLRDELKTAGNKIRENVDAVKDEVVGEAEKLLHLLEEGGYIGGTGTMEETSRDDRERYLTRFEKLAKKIRNVNPAEYESVKAIHGAYRDVLETDLKTGSTSVLASLARLCIYGRLPFMRERQGEEYMLFDSLKLSRIERQLNTLLATAGISLITATPFSDRLEEGDFEEAIGAINNLDYICPNSRQHLAKADRSNTEDLIVDIACVGYETDGKTVEKAKVIL